MGLLQLILPKRCYACEHILMPGELYLCTSCRHSLPVITPKKLQYYFHQIDFSIAHINALDILLLFEKNNRSQKLIHRLKYRDYRHLGEILGNIQLSRVLGIHKVSNIDLIIPIPIHKRRLKSRGYNQLDTYAEVFSNALQIPIRNDILIKKELHERLAKLNFILRKETIKNTFELCNKAELQDKHILLLDDILTTGATLNEVINNLNAIKNCKISVACMAFTKPWD